MVEKKTTNRKKKTTNRNMGLTQVVRKRRGDHPSLCNIGNSEFLFQKFLPTHHGDSIFFLSSSFNFSFFEKAYSLPSKGHVQTGTQVLVHSLSLSHGRLMLCKLMRSGAGSRAHFASGCLERLEIDRVLIVIFIQRDSILEHAASRNRWLGSLQAFALRGRWWRGRP